MKVIDYPTTIEYTKNDIRKVQDTLIEMAKEVHKIFGKYKIKYFITFGTLLGAVRHEGFIPWDDDFDIFIFDEDYDMAINYLERELPEWLLIHNENNDSKYFHSWSRLRDLRSETYSVCSPDDDKYKYRGITLDLFRLKKVKRCQVQENILKENIDFYKRKYNKDLIQRTTLLNKMTALYPKYIYELIKSFFSTNNDFVYSFIIDLKIIENDWIFPLKKYKFEDVKFWGPNNPDKILTKAYGDYMKIPNYENRKPHYSQVKFKI